MERITIKELDNIIRTVFNDKLVRSVETVYEKREDVNTLIFSLHDIEMEDTVIIHTKFIFKVDEDRTHLVENNFSYLKNLGCGYEYVNFENSEELESNLNRIISTNDFDVELQTLSEFISMTPGTMINEHFFSRGVENINVQQFRYNPRTKISPCYETTYDFLMVVNDTYEIEISIRRDDPKKDKSTFTITFRLEELRKITVPNISNLPKIIGDEVIDIMEDIIEE